MNLNQLKYLIRESVVGLLNEKAKKKNVLKISEKPDPLHHLQGSKKLGGSNKGKKKEIKATTSVSDEACEVECHDDVDDYVKVFHEKSDTDQHEAEDDFKFSKKTEKTKKQKPQSEIKAENYARKLSLVEGWFGIGDDVAPDDDDGQRSMDPFNMKKLRGHFMGKKYESSDESKNAFYDASEMRLCFGSSLKRNEMLNITTIFDLLDRLSYILDDCNLKYMTISPYSVEQAKKLYTRDAKGSGLFVICLNVTEEYNLWSEIHLNEEQNDMSLIYDKYGKPDLNGDDAWADFWNWLLKDVLKVEMVDTRLFSNLKNKNDSQGFDLQGVGCYVTAGLDDKIENMIDKLDRLKSKGIPKDKSGKLQYLLKILKNNRWPADNKELTDQQKSDIKAEIQKMRRENESWSSWGKRGLGLDDENEDDI